MMRSNISLPALGMFFALLASTLLQTLFCQENSSLGRIAVLRIKNINPTPANEASIRDFPQRLSSALVGTKSFNVPNETALLEALEDKDIKPEGLVGLEECFDAATALQANYMVIGSVSQTTQTLYCHLRVYSVAEKALKDVISANSSLQELENTANVIADRIRQAVENPAPIDTAYRSFTWAHEFRFAFGPTRIDLQPPLVHFVNHQPPFEISVIVQMGRVGNSYAVTVFDIYADNDLIASVDPDIMPPRLLREHEVSIGGHSYCFQANVKELRGQFGRAITSAHVMITARFCGEE